MNTISNIPASIEWRVYKGDTAAITIFVQDDLGNDIDLSNYTITGQIRTSPKDAEPLQDLVITTNISLLYINIADTTALPRTSYFDIQVDNNDGMIQSILKGNIVLEDDVTR